jgi:hypothetical protein
MTHMTTSGTTTSAEVAAYAAAVRDALADLEPSEARALLDGLDDHLAEVAAADPGVSLVDALGPAPAYADELRRSAGAPTAKVHGNSPAAAAMPLPPPPPPPSSAAPTAPRAVPESGSAFSDDRHAASRRLLWRVVLGAVVAIAGMLLVISMSTSQRIGSGQVVLGAAIVGGAWLVAWLALHRGALSDRGRRRGGVLLGGIAVLGAVAMGGRLAHDRTQYQSYYPDGSGECCLSGLTTIAFPQAVMTTTLPTTTAPAFGEFSVPDVTGLQLNQAIAVLSGSGLGYAVEQTSTSAVASGTVVGQSIGPGALVGPQTIVTVFVAGDGAASPAVPEGATATTLPVPVAVTVATQTTIADAQDDASMSSTTVPAMTATTVATTVEATTSLEGTTIVAATTVSTTATGR